MTETAIEMLCQAVDASAMMRHLQEFARLMDVHWQRKKQRSGGMSNPQIDKWYDLAMANGALGGKLIGAGGGVKGGMSYGVSDDYGDGPAENPVHVHDFHATILHLMGLDHKRLTYRYSGRDFRLTDVHGNVVRDVIA